MKMSKPTHSFDREAHELFDFQSRECAPLREYLELTGWKNGDGILYLPIELFKTHKVYCGERVDGGAPELTFRSSGTGGAGNSVHYIARAADYEAAFREGFKKAYGEGAQIYALLPGYRPESSLIYMVRGLGGRFFLDDYEGLFKALEEEKDGGGAKILFGVSHALLDLAEKMPRRLPQGVVVMETGGMKGRREELTKWELHRRLTEAFGVGEIHSEYGMAELSSQAWSHGGGIFECGPQMKVVARDVNDPFRLLHAEGRGGLNIIDLANRYSCAFIQTQDVGRVFEDGRFTVDGRISRSETRGCNLMIND